MNHMKNIILLGATGSIGSQVLDILRENSEYKLKSISFGKNIKKAIEIIKEFSPEYVACERKEDSDKLKEIFPKLNTSYGLDGLIKAVTFVDEKSYVINSIVGMVGLTPTIEGIKQGHDILLANKETLVVAGKIIKDLVNKYNVRLIPIDSEHSTIFQCLLGNKKEDVRRIIITASGGSFRDKSRSELVDVKVEDALKHPNWQMGAKITIDSATMVNKGLEVIEAHYLFDIDYENIETVIHPESIVHSMVEYKDGSIIAGLSYPDMKVPIAYALSTPRRNDYSFIRKMDFSKMFSLNFKPMDMNRFPLLKLAYEVGKMGGIMPMVYNTANEVAVKLFLDGKIKFLEIEDIVFYAVKNATNIIDPTINDILNYDKVLRKELEDKFEVK